MQSEQLKWFSTSRPRRTLLNVAMFVCVTLMLSILAGCATKIAKINPALTERIPAPGLKGRTYNDAIVLGVKSRAVIKRFNCRTYVLRKVRLPKKCTGGK